MFAEVVVAETADGFVLRGLPHHVGGVVVPAQGIAAEGGCAVCTQAAIQEYGRQPGARIHRVHGVVVAGFAQFVCRWRRVALQYCRLIRYRRCLLCDRCSRLHAPQFRAVRGQHAQHDRAILCDAAVREHGGVGVAQARQFGRAGRAVATRCGGADGCGSDRITPPPAIGWLCQ